MTREELVKQKAQEFASRGEYSPALTESFVAGAEWEHKRLVEKVCEWLKNTIYDDVFVSRGSVIKYMSANEFVEYFRKVMEE